MFLHRIILAELAGLDTEPQRHLASTFINEPDTSLDALLATERTKLAISLSDPDKGDLPSPIALCLNKFLNEEPSSGLRLIYRLMDCFEVLVRFVAVVSINDVVEKSKLPEALRQLLVDHLTRPSLGHWMAYALGSIKALAAYETPPFMPELLYYRRALASRSGEALLSLRNAYAHGAKPEDKDCLEDLARVLPDFLVLLAGATFLKRYRVIFSMEGRVMEARGLRHSASNAKLESNGDVALLSPDQDRMLLLSTLMGCRTVQGTSQIFFYNDQKKKHALTYHSYDAASWILDRNTYPRFTEQFPLSDWNFAHDESPFQERIDQLTRNFVGRFEEIVQISRWLMRPSGFFMLIANPGMGKTALLALISSPEVLTELIDQYTESDWPQQRPEEWSPSDWPVVSERSSWLEHWKTEFRDVLGIVDIVPYFITRGDFSSSPLEFLRTLLQNLASTFQLRAATTGDLEDLARELRHQLSQIARLLRERNRKLLVIIDGLDESLAAQTDSDSNRTIVDFLPTWLPDGVFFLMAGRPRPAVENLYGNLDRERRTRLTLNGLSANNIRAMLFEATSKYELRAEYAEEIQVRSAGNPLFVNRLADDILEGYRSANDLKGLPRSLVGMYQDELARLCGHESQATVNLLMTLAVTREQLSTQQLAAINELELAPTQGIVESCRDVLSERRRSNGQSKYQIFHDSFADFLRQHKDYASIIPVTELRFLLYASESENRPLEDFEKRALKQLVMGNDSLDPEVAETLIPLFERSCRMLTPPSIILAQLNRRNFLDMKSAYEIFATTSASATSGILKNSIVAQAVCAPEAVREFLRHLLARSISDDTVARDQGQLQAVRIALESSVELARQNLFHETVVENLVTAAWHPNLNIQTLGILAAYRVATIDQALALEIIRRLAENVTRYGFIRLQKVTPLVGVLVGLLFDHTDNQQLMKELGTETKLLLKRIRGLKLATWLFPPIMATFLATVPDDYNPMNLGEMKNSKKRLKKNPELRTTLLRIVDMIHPQVGTERELRSLVETLRPDRIAVEDGFAINYVFGTAVMSRYLAGETSALDLSFEFWNWWKDTESIACQDIPFELRVIQQALKLRERPPLGQEWNDKATTVLKNLYHEREAHFRISKRYVGGGIVCGVPFLAHQLGKPEVPLLRELIDDACFRQQATAGPSQDRRHDRDVILLRTTEVVGIEYGTYDHLARAAAFFGLRCFLHHSDGFDKTMWLNLIRIVARLRIYFPSDVEVFLAGLSPPLEEKLRVGLNQTLPDENLGALISMKTECLFASCLSEPAAQTDGLRGTFQEALRLVVSSKRLSGTLRGLLRLMFASLQA